MILLPGAWWRSVWLVPLLGDFWFHLAEPLVQPKERHRVEDTKKNKIKKTAPETLNHDPKSWYPTQSYAALERRITTCQKIV